MSVCGSPRGLPQAYHTQAVRDELPESEGEGKKGEGGMEAGRRGRAGGMEGEKAGVLFAQRSAPCLCSLRFSLPSSLFSPLHTRSAGREKM